MAIGSTVYILTPQIKTTQFLKAFELKKAVFMHIWITESRIRILFLSTPFFRCLGFVSRVSWISDVRFAFEHPKPQKT